MLLRRAPNLFFQVRSMTTRRPKYENTELREQKIIIRDWAMGKRQLPAVTASRNDAVFAIQQRVFGYDRGGEGYIPEGKVIPPGKKPVPVRTGRKIARKGSAVPDLTSWYPVDLLGKLRFREMRIMKKNPVSHIERYLGVHKVKDVGLEDFGPHLEYTPEWERAKLRARAERVLASVQVDPSITALDKLKADKRREKRLYSLRKRGKGAPKKGQGKRATGGKPGKK